MRATPPATRAPFPATSLGPHLPSDTVARTSTGPGVLSESVHPARGEDVAPSRRAPLVAAGARRVEGSG